MTFKSQVIYFDKSKHDTKISNAGIVAEEVNKIFEEVDSLLEIKPTKEKRKRLIEEGYEYVLDELRQNFPFPNANDEFNFSAMGIDPKPLIPLLKGIGLKVSEHNLNLEGNKVALTEKSLKDIKEECTYSTRNEEENKKYDFAKKLCDFLNENNQEMQKYCKVFRGQGVGERMGGKIFDNFILVSRNGEDYKYVPAPPRV